MPQRHFKSIEEWRRDEGARRRKAASRQPTPRSPSSPAGGRLCVEADIAPHADPSAMRECRAIVLDWLQERMGGKLPRKALRHGSFSRGGEEAACRAVRVRDARRDCWAAQLERRPGAGRTIVTEVVVGREARGGATVGIDVVDRSVVPADCVAEYPAEMLAAMGERVPLLQRGRTLSRAPIVVDSPESMQGFHRMLVDPRRETPFAVVSVPPRHRRPGVPALAVAGAGRCADGTGHRVGAATGDDVPSQRPCGQAPVGVPRRVEVLPPRVRPSGRQDRSSALPQEQDGRRAGGGRGHQAMPLACRPRTYAQGDGYRSRVRLPDPGSGGFGSRPRTRASGRLPEGVAGGDARCNDSSTPPPRARRAPPGADCSPTGRGAATRPHPRRSASRRPAPRGRRFGTRRRCCAAS